MSENKVSKQYLKAYNQADMICRYMPHLISKIKDNPKGEPNQYREGFEDRLKQYEREKEVHKQFSSPNRAMDKSKDRDIDL